jgi:hypothetical protein
LEELGTDRYLGCGSNMLTWGTMPVNQVTALQSQQLIGRTEGSTAVRGCRCWTDMVRHEDPEALVS